MRILIILLIIVTLLLIALNVHLSLQVRKLELKYKRFMKGRDGISLEDSFAEKFEEIDKLNDLAKVLRSDLRDLRAIERKNFTKYGIVKYDAFEDVGGRLSFALALLNEEDTGIVMNAIHSKDNCFLYLKEIVKGESYIMLSNEEVRALQTAKKIELLTDTEELMSTIEQIEEITKKDSTIIKKSDKKEDVEEDKKSANLDDMEDIDDLDEFDDADDLDDFDDFEDLDTGINNTDEEIPREWVSSPEDDIDALMEDEEI